jgi:hypothetical protein
MASVRIDAGPGTRLIDGELKVGPRVYEVPALEWSKVEADRPALSTLRVE